MSADPKSISEARAAMNDVRFTKRQELTYEAYILMNKGMSKRQIAETLGVSESTIRKILIESTSETSPLERELASVLNKYSAENESNTPDFILAEYLMSCLNAFNTASNSRQEFHGEGTILNEK